MSAPVNAWATTGAALERLIGVTCVDGPLVQGAAAGFGDRCDCGRVSGLFARHLAAGPDGFRARCPNAIAAFSGRVTPLGVPDVGSTDRHLPFTALLHLAPARRLEHFAS